MLSPNIRSANQLPNREELIKTQPKILIIEDDPDILEFYKFTLEDIDDISVDFASGPEDGIVMLGKFNYAVVMVDWSARGPEISRQAKEKDKKIRTVVATGRQKHEVLECPYVDGYLGKPFADISFLEQEIRRNVSLWQEANNSL